MTEASGTPEVGNGARLLGVRDGEITVVNNMVQADGKGMSTAQGGPKKLPSHRRPKEHGGSGKDPVWRISRASVNTTVLDPINDHGDHVSIAAKKPVTLDEYRTALAATKGSWTKV